MDRFQVFVVTMHVCTISVNFNVFNCFFSPGPFLYMVPETLTWFEIDCITAFLRTVTNMSSLHANVARLKARRGFIK